ncbi:MULTISPECIES: hypothetical protein [Rhizobium]|nr:MULTISPECIES: hypothetical protein [Rhizobium]MBB4508231.1 hypothetical protein [Rhizobium leguminosarum]WSG96891.1 hypothetical protein U8P76_08670 [Rhizobium johnstonii]WSH09584.1 hypothetical protein U8P72_08480 [Rhizobium johnstonii]WSH45855.1 hypothetical protein U8P77_08500 [Rhizobium johnstonii]
MPPLRRDVSSAIVSGGKKPSSDFEIAAPRVFFRRAALQHFD